MSRELGVWVTPFTTLRSIHDAIGVARELAASISSATNIWTARLIAPVHYGPYPQAQCRQNLPADMRSASPADVMPMRALVNSKGLRFGVWGVPIDPSCAGLAADYAAAGGWYSANFEPTASFWAPGDDPAAIDQWWSTFWNRLADPSQLDGRAQATLVPNSWGIGAFRTSISNLTGGCNALSLEVYGGPQTSSSYPYPNLWPTESFDATRATGTTATLVPILARANLHAQIAEAASLNPTQVQLWAI